MSKSEFFTAIKRYGIARTNRFRVDIPLPKQLQEAVSEGSDEFSILKSIGTVVKIFAGTSGDVTRGLSLMCESTELPSFNIATSENRHNGDTFHMPYGVLYNVQPFTFLCSSQLYEKNIIDKWMSLIVNKQSHEISFYDDIVVDITIHQLNKFDQPIHSVVLKECYPKMISPLPMSNADADTFHRVSCEFAFRKWIKEGDLVDNADGFNAAGTIGGTALFPIISEVINNPLAIKTLNILKEQGIDVTGEALNIYNSLDKIIFESTGTSINESLNAVNKVKIDILSNIHISENERSTLLDGVNTVLSSISS